jgi:RNA recognition motif-containing protein
MNICVGNLSFDVNEEDLRKAFEDFGKIESVNLIKDKYSGQSRGFGFVEMSDKAEAQSAVKGLNGKELKGRALSVNEARPRSEGRGSSGRGGGGHRGQGGYGGGRGGGRRFQEKMPESNRTVSSAGRPLGRYTDERTMRW